MKIRTMALIGGVFAVLGGVGVVACSSSNSNGGGGSDNDAGNNNGGDSSVVNNGDSGNTNPGDSSVVTPEDGGTTTADASCKSPTLHVPKVDGGVYCPYSFNDATDAGVQYCANGTQQCCLSGGGDAGPSVCQAFDPSTQAYNGGLGSCATVYEKAWQCSSPLDCESAGPVIPNAPAGAAGDPIVCCLVGGSLEAASTASGYCSTAQKSYFGGTTCQPKSACAGEYKYGDASTDEDLLYTVCEQDSDCTGTGQHCQAIYVTGTSIGVCIPQ